MKRIPEEERPRTRPKIAFNPNLGCCFPEAELDGLLMNWMSDIDEALKTRSAQGKRLLAIFKGDGDWCRWCNALDGLLKESDALDRYLEREGILGAKVLIPRKSEDTSGIRERFGITGIPFFLFYSDEGTIEGATEFIDDGDAQSYVDWIENVDTSGF